MLLVIVHDGLAGLGDFLPQPGRFQDADAAAFSENPLDDVVFDAGFEVDNEGSVGLFVEPRLVFFLLFVDVEGDGGIAVEANAGNFVEDEKAVGAGVGDEFFVGREALAGIVGADEALNGKDYDLFRAVEVALAVPPKLFTF